MNVNEQQTVDNYEIDICEFEEVKDIDPVSKRNKSNVVIALILYWIVIN